VFLRPWLIFERIAKRNVGSDTGIRDRPYWESPVKPRKLRKHWRFDVFRLSSPSNFSSLYPRKVNRRSTVTLRAARLRRGRRAGQGRKVVIERVLKPHRAGRHNSEAPVIGIGLPGPVVAATGNPVKTIFQQPAKLLGTETSGSLPRIEIAKEGKRGKGLRRGAPSRGIGDFYEISGELFQVEEDRNRDDLLTQCVNEQGAQYTASWDVRVRAV